jgi:hypothetical protein
MDIGKQGRTIGKKQDSEKNEEVFLKSIVTDGEKLGDANDEDTRICLGKAEKF